jgi:hypothetical protein
MGAARIFALILIGAGVLSLIYGGFSYTKDSHEAKLGPLEFSIQHKENINIPTWAGVAAIVVGAGLLLASSRRS